MFEESSKLEKIGPFCFCNSGLEKITLPKTLKEIGCYALDGCSNLKVISVEDGCNASLSDANV